MLESIREFLYKWTLKKHSDCLYTNLFVYRFGDEFHHIDYLMVVDNQIFLVKYYNYIGNIYGADNISEWTQTIGHSGFKFNNPLRELREIVNQIKDSLPDFEIDFYIMFADKCNFPKPMPEGVIKRSALLGIMKQYQKSASRRNCEDIRNQLDVILKS